MASSSSPSSGSAQPSEPYVYYPLHAPAQIRVLELMRSDDMSAPIHIQLHHVPLAEVTKVEALSYEWGPPLQSTVIFCEGKILNVTSNLAAALVRLRDRGPDPTYIMSVDEVELNIVPQKSAIEEANSNGVLPVGVTEEEESMRRSGFWQSAKQKLGRKAPSLSSSSRPISSSKLHASSSTGGVSELGLEPENDLEFRSTNGSKTTKSGTIPIRRSTRQSYLLWIDALCIDQSNMTERSQQVLLMTGIYSLARHVVIWAGEELPNNRTRDAYDLTFPLVNQLKYLPGHLSFFDSEEAFAFKDFVLDDRTRLGDLKQHPLCAAVVDFLASRTVFNRLWTFQEVVLARESQVTVQFGSVCISWLAFHRLVCVLMTCPLMREEEWSPQKFAILTSIFTRFGRQLRYRSEGMEFQHALNATAACTVTDERDRVFGILGLVKPWIKAALSTLNYENSLVEIMAGATMIVVIESESLSYLHEISILVHQDNPNHGWQPSWVWKSDCTQITGRVEGMHGMEELRTIVDVQSIDFQGLEMVASGWVIDTVDYAYVNFTESNFKDLLFDIRCNMTVPVAQNIPVDPIERLWPLFTTREEQFEQDSSHDSGDGHDFKNGHDAMMAHLAMTEYFAWQREQIHMLEGGPVDVSNLKWRNVEISDLMAGMQLADGQKHFQYVVGSMLSGFPRDYGRNVFKTSRGYYGVGRRGKSDGVSSVVQVGDKIGIFPQADGPLILRPCDEEGVYSLIGAAFIPFILGDESLQRENMAPLQRIRIV